MSDYMMFVDWLVQTILTFWNFWMQQHFIFKALLLSPLLVMIVGLLYSTFHSEV